jgi:hypothetical protein
MAACIASRDRVTFPPKTICVPALVARAMASSKVAV